MLLLKLPMPLPSEVWLSATVGLCEVLQQTPRAVTVEPPEEVTSPPQVAVVVVILETLPVITVGRETAGGISVTEALCEQLLSHTADTVYSQLENIGL